MQDSLQGISTRYMRAYLVTDFAEILSLARSTSVAASRHLMPYLIVFALIAAADYACVRYSGTAYKHQTVSAPICWHCDLDSNAKWGGIF